MKYEKPKVTMIGADFGLLQTSEIGPGATDIGAPNVSNEAKSVWDEVNEQYNINNKEESYEDWI